MKKKKIILISLSAFLGVMLLGGIIYCSGNRIKTLKQKHDEIVISDNGMKYDGNVHLKPNFNATFQNVTIEMNIPKEWHYEESAIVNEDDSYEYALKLYKSHDDKYATLYIFDSQFVVCGTGRINKTIILNNGGKAKVGYYGTEDDVWNDISFYELNPDIAFINFGLEGDEAEEILNIVKTINIK